MDDQRTGVTARFRAAAGWGLGVLVIMMLWSAGCGRNSSDYSHFPANAEGLFLSGIRPPAGDTTRLLRNAHYLKLMGRPELALRELEAAYHQDPGNIRVLNTLALAYDEMGEFSRAQKLYQEALALDVSNQALNNNLCFSYYLAGQWDKAETCFRQALTRNPHNIMARNNLGLLLCRRGRTEEARRLWQEAEGEMAAQKKMQQVMVALGIKDYSHYARLPQPVPAAASLPRDSSTPASTVAKETTPAKPALPNAASPRPQPPAAPPVKAREPLKLAANPSPAAVPPNKEKGNLPTAAKPAPPQPKEPTAAVKTQSPPASPKTAAKPAPAVVPKKPGPRVLAAAPAKPQSPPERPKRTADTEKKPAPATTPAKTPPPPSKPGKVKLGATPPTRPLTPEKPAHGIEVENGSGAQNLARETRTRLSEAGFKVVSIGNYRDFGMENTVIYYRPGAEKAAQALSAKFFPKSRLEIGEKFAKNSDIKVILGKDLLEPQTLAAESALNLEKVAAEKESRPPEAKPRASASAPVQVITRPKTTATPASVSPPVKTKAVVQKAEPKPYLTAAELINQAIDIRNGSGAHNLAHKARSMLSQEGFNVASIGNHIDFGAEKTIIYYRPGAEKIAKNLRSRFFAHSQMQKTTKLPEGVAVKLLLGKDLMQRSEVMAKLED